MFSLISLIHAAARPVFVPAPAAIRTAPVAAANDAATPVARAA